jgi:hypothetical protein
LHRGLIWSLNVQTVQFSPKTFIFGQIRHCVDAVLYISIREIKNTPFTHSSCRPNIYVLILL